jgi:hypothetical protein
MAAAQLLNPKASAQAFKPSVDSVLITAEDVRHLAVMFFAQLFFALRGVPGIGLCLIKIGHELHYLGLVT